MELIPILSTIILVATISTFLLAIGAYILYKIREKRGKKVVKTAESTVQAELITPEGSAVSQQDMRGSSAPRQGQREQGQPGYAPQPAAQPIFIQQSTQQPERDYSKPRHINIPQQKIKAPNVPQSAQGPQQNNVRGYQGPSYATAGRVNEAPRATRFVQYTTEGYVTTKEEKNKESLKWR